MAGAAERTVGTAAPLPGCGTALTQAAVCRRARRQLTSRSFVQRIGHANAPLHDVLPQKAGHPAEGRWPILSPVSCPIPVWVSDRFWYEHLAVEQVRVQYKDCRHLRFGGLDRVTAN